MKKITVCAMSAVLAAAFLCGCGAGMNGDNTVAETPIVAPVPSPVPSPQVSPIVTPDVEDGIVDDRDGFIEEPGADKRIPSPSPSPKVTAPSATAKP